jgi:predicted NUDIX family NTP pyrophosphohydrolase
MPERSAGILLYRRGTAGLEVFLVHPGGPFWSKKDEGAWSLPKGILDPEEAPEPAARREFAEEVGEVPAGPLTFLGEFRQKSGKLLLAFALEGDFDPARLVSNTFEMEWPPRSGQRASFPEVDRGAWFAPDDGVRKINPGQAPAIAELRRLVGG